MNMLATRLLKERGIDIVGAINRPGPKIGKDLGLVSGIDYLNVPISDDPEKVLSKTADIVIVAVASELPIMFPIYKQCLEARKNVATIGESSSFSWRLYPELTVELDNIAKEYGVPITGTGAQDFGIVHLGIFHIPTLQNIKYRIIIFNVTCNLRDIDSFGKYVKQKHCFFVKSWKTPQLKFSTKLVFCAFCVHILFCEKIF